MTPTAEPSEAPVDTPTPALYTLAGLVDIAVAEAQTLYAAREKGKIIGPQTPIPVLTEILGARLAPGPHIVHGGPGTGKTAFGLQTVATCGCPAIFITCEMSPIELLNRITSRVTRTYLGKLKGGYMHPNAVRESYLEAAAKTPEMAILDATIVPLDASLLLATAQEFRRAFPDAEHFLLVLDSVHSWASGSDSDDEEYTKLTRALEDIRVIAAQLCSPVLCIAERNRAGMKKGGMHASAGTRRFEYGAESVIELDRADGASADAFGDIPVALSVSKNRHGETKSNIPLLFNGRTQTFREA